MGRVTMKLVLLLAMRLRLMRMPTESIGNFPLLGAAS